MKIIAKILVTLLTLFNLLACSKEKEKIVIGISPYQDTVLPVVAQEKGWYKDEGLNVEIKVLDWGDVMNSVAGGAVDVAIQNFNSFQATYNNISEKGVDVIFYYPLFVFKGTAIMTKSSSGLKPLSEYLKIYPKDRERAIIETIRQLKGKKVITTKGTEMEQIVVSAISKAGLSMSDVTVIHASPSDGLNAFLRGECDFYSGGVTERTEARKNGAVELIETSDINAAVIDGLVTNKEFAKKHPDELRKIIKIWYKTIDWMGANIDGRSSVVLSYLVKTSSTVYTKEQYKYTWYNTEIFPKNTREMSDVVFDSTSTYYWKKSWDENNKYLLDNKKIQKVVPQDAFWGADIQKSL